jgi:hypothetical protein
MDVDRKKDMMELQFNLNRAPSLTPSDNRATPRWQVRDFLDLLLCESVFFYTQV